MEEKKVEENEPREKEVVKKTEAAYYTWYMFDLWGISIYHIPRSRKKGWEFYVPNYRDLPITVCRLGCSYG